MLYCSMHQFIAQIAFCLDGHPVTTHQYSRDKTNSSQPEA